MKFRSKDQERAYKKAMARTYKAAAFDVDGTLTEFAKFTIPDDLLATMEKIPLDIPLVLCTGRPIDFLSGKMEMICNSTRNPEEQRRRWWIIAENGGAGYTYNAKIEEYEMFFEVKWPSEVIEMEVLAAHLKDKLGWNIKILQRAYTLVVIYPKWMYLFPRFVKARSLMVSKKITTLLKKRGLGKAFTAQNSGLGTLIVPKASGKGNAIKRFAKELGIPMKQVLCVGDSPQAGGNDEDFLAGHFGTPFTVGPVLKKTYPLPVLNDQHIHLSGPKGTKYLLDQIF
jgi:HAD superfamily hydrolase (TIGR01484 family)